MASITETVASVCRTAMPFVYHTNFKYKLNFSTTIIKSIAFSVYLMVLLIFFLVKSAEATVGVWKEVGKTFL